MLMFICATASAEETELDVSTGKTAVLVNTSASKETDASALLTSAGYTTDNNTAAVDAGMAIQWGEKGYIDIALEEEVIINRIAWTKNHVFGAVGALTVYASDNADFSESVLLGELTGGETVFANEEYYKYVRLEKSANYDFYPGQITVYGYKRPFVFNGTTNESVNTDTAVELVFSEMLSSNTDVSKIKVIKSGAAADTDISLNENKIIVAPKNTWKSGGIYEITIPAGTVIASDTRTVSDNINVHFAVSTDNIRVLQYSIENNILTFIAENTSDNDIDMCIWVVEYNDDNTVKSVSEHLGTIKTDEKYEAFISVPENFSIYTFEDAVNMKMLLSCFGNVLIADSTEATEETTAKYVDGSVIVSGVSQSSEITAFLTAEKISASDLKAAGTASVKNGKYMIKMVLGSDTVSGDYTVWVSDGKTDSPEKLTVYVLDEADKQLYAEQIAKMNAEELGVFFETKEKILDGIGVIEERPNNMESLYASIAAQELEGTYTDIVKKINTELVLGITKEKGFIYAISVYNDYLGVDTSEELYSYVYENEIQESAQTFMNNDYDDVEEFKVELGSALKLAVFTNAPSAEYAMGFAEGNNDFFGFDFDDEYSDLSMLNQKNVIKQAMQGTSLSDIQSKFEDAVEKYKKSTSKNSGGGGGGGGGGSSTSAIVTNSSIPQELPEIQIGDLSETETVSEQEFKFSDLDESHWAYNPVTELAKKGIVNGYDGKFNPNANVTREEFVKMLVTAVGIETESANVFEDVADDAWYAPYVSAAKNSGIVNGISETHFGTGLYITRQDIAVMLYNTLKDITFEESEKEVPFADEEEISDYAKEPVRVLTLINMIEGRDENRFAPTENATRAEAAALIYRLINQIS